MLLTHVEEGTPVQSGPCDFTFLAYLFEVFAYPEFCSNECFGESYVLLPCHVADKLVCEEEFDTGFDRGINDEFGRVVLCCSSCDAVHDGVLANKCF